MPRPRIADFYFRHFTKFLIIAVILQIFVISAVGVSVWYVFEQQLLPIESLLVTGGAAMLALELLATTFTLRLFGKPLQILTDAVTHVSKQAHATAPPVINKRRYERSGLKKLVQTIYELSLASARPVDGMSETNDTPNDTPIQPDILRTIMKVLPGDIIVYNNQAQISFYHGDNVVVVTPDGLHQPTLRFTQDNNFTTWLADCRANKVRDTKMWKRIPNALVGEDDRRIFDVIAHYEKSSITEVETVLLLIDRTAEYARADEDMDFIALAAHELRAPLTVIRGYLDVLNDELANTLQGDQKDLLARVQVSAERLSGYINNILNVSKYDRAHLKLHLREESLAGILRELVEDLALRAYTQHRKLEFKIPTGLPTVAADRSSLSEVIINLVDNAIKYSNDEGKIIVSASVKDNFVEFSVQDFGVGMPSSVVNNLFTRFYRSHRSRQAVSGTGLGLFISKAIVESHGGKIWVTSTEGQGSIFGVQLPIYATVADKLSKDDNRNEGIIESNHGWIKNHSMYRR